MLDLKFIRDNIDLVRQAMDNRCTAAPLDEILQLDSERRLMYVAVTRASRAVLLSRPKARKTRFGARFQQPSRFLSEMGIQTEV